MRRAFIGSPAEIVKLPTVNAVRLDADFILAREGLQLTQRLDGDVTCYGAKNGVGLVLAESLGFLSLSEWIAQFERR